MTGETIRSFVPATRVHMSLEVADLPTAIQFYERLLGVAPAKLRDGYAKFESVEPCLNLALNEVPDRPRGRTGHFGIEVKSTRAVAAAMARMSEAGLASTPATESCCFAFQEKAWVHDPDGHSWEIFVVLADDDSPAAATASATCCAR